MPPIPLTAAVGGVPVACSLPDPALRARAEQVRAELFSGALETRELEDGYAFRFPAGREWFDRIAEFVAFERTCCTFLSFDLSFERANGPAWMSLTGPEGTKAFLRDLVGPVQKL